MGQADIAVAGQAGELGRGVLAAAVSVKDHSRGRVAGGDRVGQGVGDELGAQVIGQGEPDDAAGGDVDDGGQEQPPLPGADVGDVPAPAGVERCRVGGEVPADPVRSCGGGRVRNGWGCPALTDGVA